ncbi:fluoride efflux transporter FluC [Pseudarthrobacter sp. NPDC058362]|uniref:fluoride efflux transporter FluC n=1 Tax=Pseudarthrobacter sp. NPDC058362 TaxID=3346458 RepID=UPI003650EACC
MTALLVGLFGMAGAMLRFAVDSWFAHHSARRSVRGPGGSGRLHWPWATLLVNVAGCFLIGLTYAATEGAAMSPEWRTAAATGLAGGLTTFSSWTTATVRLFSEARFSAGAMNVATNLVLGFAAAAAGAALVT